MIFDTHAHYDDPRFDADRDDVLASVAAAGVGLIVDPASDVVTAKKARDIAESHAFVYFAAGIHPNESEAMRPGDLEEIRALLCHPKCVAVGEIGLDYHWQDNRAGQQELFRTQLELARETGKPAIVHERDAVADCLAILRDFGDIRGVVHCFSGSWETAKVILDLGWYISFTGVLTFKNARRAVEAAARIPLDRLMVETDSPYMAPEPVRGTRNDSRNVIHVIRKLAEIKGLDPAEAERITWENGKRFYGIREP